MKKMICIVCPNGCRLEVSGTPENLEVAGAKCKKGKAYALAELSNPTRSLTTTVRTAFPEARVLPVRTAGEIPKDQMFEVMAYLNAFVLETRVSRGETVAKNVLDTGIDIIATSGILAE